MALLYRNANYWMWRQELIKDRKNYEMDSNSTNLNKLKRWLVFTSTTIALYLVPVAARRDRLLRYH